MYGILDVMDKFKPFKGCAWKIIGYKHVKKFHIK